MSSSDLALTGLKGDNLLGFLAALGVLKTATAAFPDRAVRLAWTRANGGWHATLKMASNIREDDFIECLSQQLAHGKSNPALVFADNLNVTGPVFRAVVNEAAKACTPEARTVVDLLAAFACESLIIDEKESKIQDTALRTMSGAGHQHFLGSMRELVLATKLAHLHSALFSSWRHDDDKPSLRWDPQDDRRYALRWKEPAGDPGKTVRGANRLAMEGMALLPSFPVGATLQTTGMTRRKYQGISITWPLWEAGIGLDTLRSLLALEQLQRKIPDRDALAAMGVNEVFRSFRITQGKFRNFSTAVSV